MPGPSSRRQVFQRARASGGCPKASKSSKRSAYADRATRREDFAAADRRSAERGRAARAVTRVGTRKALRLSLRLSPVVESIHGLHQVLAPGSDGGLCALCRRDAFAGGTFHQSVRLPQVLPAGRSRCLRGPPPQGRDEDDIRVLDLVVLKRSTGLRLGFSPCVASPATSLRAEGVVVVVGRVVDRPAAPRVHRVAPARRVRVPDVRHRLVCIGRPSRTLAWRQAVVAPVVHQRHAADLGADFQIAVGGNRGSLVGGDQRFFGGYECLGLLYGVSCIANVPRELVEKRGVPRLEVVGVAPRELGVDQVLEPGGRRSAVASSCCRQALGAA